MALTLSKVYQGVDATGKRFVEADVAFDNSYPTGGEDVSLAALGLNVVDRVEIVFGVTPFSYGRGNPATTATHGRQIVPVLTNPQAPKLKVFSGNNTEATNASDQTQVVSRLRFVGS